MGWQGILDSSGILFTGFVNTLTLSIATIVLGTALGLVVGVLRAARVPALRAPLRIYLEVFRGSPLLVQMLFIYFGAAYLGLRGVETFIAALVALTLYEGALISEIFRAGIEAVPKGQREAARSIGLALQIEHYVIRPDGHIAPPTRPASALAGHASPRRSD
jgi:polar amino acid transport system permease protein